MAGYRSYMARPIIPLVDKLLRNIVIESTTGCWLYAQIRSRGRGHGYGFIRVNGRRRPAHRVVYELFKGPISEGLILDHLCRTPACCNPDHLEPVTPRENTRRGIGPTAKKMAQTECARGHDFDGITGQGYRFCKECKLIRQRESRATRRMTISPQQ